MRIITIATQKGGTGKSTVAVNLAAGLARAGHRTLLIDVDPQANTTYVLTGSQHIDPSLYDVIVSNSASIKEVAISVRLDLDLVPANILLSAADITLSSVPGREWLISRRLRALQTPEAAGKGKGKDKDKDKDKDKGKDKNKGYEFVIMDTPPSLGILTVNALVASSEVVVPVAMSTFALIGLGLLENTIAQLKENLEIKDLHIVGAIPTFYDRTNVARDTMNILKEHFGPLLLESSIPRTVKMEEANNRLKTIYEYEPGGVAANAFEALAKEVISLG